MVLGRVDRQLSRCGDRDWRGPDDEPGEVDATSELVKVARKVRVCPRCGSRETVRIQYGMPAYSERLEADLAVHRVVLGGCMVWDGQPDLNCSVCGLEFLAGGRPPVVDPEW